MEVAQPYVAMDDRVMGWVEMGGAVRAYPREYPLIAKAR